MNRNVSWGFGDWERRIKNSRIPRYFLFLQTKYFSIFRALCAPVMEVVFCHPFSSRNLTNFWQVVLSLVSQKPSYVGTRFICMSKLERTPSWRKGLRKRDSEYQFGFYGLLAHLPKISGLPFWAHSFDGGKAERFPLKLAERRRGFPLPSASWVSPRKPK